MKKQLCSLISAALAISCVACRNTNKEENFNNQSESISLDNKGSQIKDPLYFLDLPWPAEGSESQSAPYLMVQHSYQSNRLVTLDADWRCDLDAENTYYNVHDWGGPYNDETGMGYAGFQNVKGGHVAIFSMWDSKQGHPKVEYYTPNARPNDFGGEGTGVNVITPYNWQVGKWYSMRIDSYTKNGKTYYDQLIREENKDWETIATISFPAPNLTMSYNISFLEDFCLNGLKRADSLRNIQARDENGSWEGSLNFYLSHSRSKYFQEDNNSLGCKVEINGNMISRTTSNAPLVNEQLFPYWIRLEVS